MITLSTSAADVLAELAEWLPSAEDAEVTVLPAKESSEPSQKTEESSAVFNPEIAKIPLQQDAESSDADEGDWGVVA